MKEAVSPMVSVRLPDLRSWGSLFLLGGLAFALYSRTLDVGFLSDDFDFLWTIRTSGWFAGWGYGNGGFFRPLTIASNAVDDWIFFGNPLGSHVVNVALHGISAWLVGCVVDRWTEPMLPGRSRMLAWASALGFAVLASHTEPVVWIACRGDLLAVPLALLATYLILADELSLGSIACACALLAAAFTAKESVVPTPGIWVAMLAVRARTETRPLRRREQIAIIAGVLTALIFLAVRASVIGSWIGGYGRDSRPPTNPAVVAVRLWLHMKRPLFPPIPDTWRRTRWMLLPPVFLTALGVALVSRIRRSTAGERAVLVGCLVAAAFACAPVLGFGAGRFGSEGERLVYFASAFVVPMVFVSFHVAFGERGGKVASVIFVVGHALGTFVAQGRWLEAANMTRRIVATLAPLDPTSTCVANLPDSVAGAFVFREGLTQAVAIQVGHPIEPFRVANGQRWGLRESASFDPSRDGGRLQLSPRAKLASTTRYPRCDVSNADEALTISSESVSPGIDRVVFVSRNEGIHLHVVPVRRLVGDGSDVDPRSAL